MIQNHLKVARRNLVKHKVNTAINVISLSIGIACFLAVSIYGYSELSFDRFHNDAADIYRVPIDFVDEKGNRIPDATTPPALAPALKANFPEVRQAVRLFPSWGNKFLLTTQDGKRFFESGFMRTDSTFFDVFTFKFLYGDAATALDGIDDIVITRSTAMKFFGEENAIGKTILRPDVEDHGGYKVSAIIEDVPKNSHFKFDFLARLTFDEIDQNWGWYNYYTYIKTGKTTDIVAFEEKLQPFFEEQSGQEEVPNIIYLQALTDIHLHSHLKWELGANGNITNIYIFGALGLFILIISCLNYLNLTVSQSVRRLKEVGVRKAFGASRKLLTQQFLTETFLTTAVSAVLGVVLAEFFLYSQKDLLGASYTIFDPQFSYLLISTLLLVLGAGLVAGVFPALKLASKDVSKAVNGITDKGSRKVDIRKVLLVFQFAISIFMLMGTIVVYKQLTHIKTLDKGLSTEQVLVIENADVLTNFEAFKNELKQYPQILSVSESDGVIGKLNWTTGIGYPESFLLNYVVTDPDLINTLDMKLKHGRNFSKDIATDKEGWKMILNETGMKELGITAQQVGESIPVAEMRDSVIYGRVLGVVEDFRFTDYKLETKPFAFFYRDNPKDYGYIKIQDSDLPNTLSFIENTWIKMGVNAPLQYFFLDQTYSELVNQEETLGNIMLFLTALSIFIAIVGMLAVVKMELRDQLKAIAVRKVLGATEWSLLQLINLRFWKLVILANVAALPLAYFGASLWLEDFSERTNIGIGLGALAFGGTIAAITLLVSLQAFRAARTNPTLTLRQDN